MWPIKRNSLRKVSKVIKLLSSWSFCLQNGFTDKSTIYKRIGFSSVRPISYWLKNSGVFIRLSVRPISYWLKLRVMGITQCQGYHSVSGLFVRKTGSLNVMGELLGGLWKLWVSVSLSVMGILLGVSVMGITQCNGYPSMSGYHSV
jgi:hypothetical protein